MAALSFHPLSDSLGAEIVGLDLTLDTGRAEFDRIARVLYDHGVLLARRHRLDVRAFVRFARRFGELEPGPNGPVSDPHADPWAQVWMVSNVAENGKPIGILGAGDVDWHSDMSYQELPPTVTMLYALEVPDEAGDTFFTNMVQVLARLPVALRRRIEGRYAVHDAGYTDAGTPGAAHPLIRSHPETGARALYLGRRGYCHVSGLPNDESDALIDELWRFCSRDEFVWRHRWRAGDLLVWDNASVAHRRDSFDPCSRRILHSVQVKGDRPR